MEVRLDGHTNLNGVNGAGKTTLLRLVPLFFGERPGRLVPKSRVTDSFAKHYLPNESSYIIFEYQRHEQTCMVLMYASSNEEGLCYRFVDKGFSRTTLSKPAGMDRIIRCLAEACAHIFLSGILIVATRLPLVAITAQ